MNQLCTPQGLNKPAGMDTQNCHTTVDGRNPALVDMVNIPYLQGSIHPKWCRISSINSMKGVPLPSDHFFYFHGVTSCDYPKCSNYRTCAYNLQIKSINDYNFISVLNIN